MYRLDDTTLEVIAETICGGGGGGGAAPYSAPGPYRSKSEIYSFFSRAGIQPSGMSSTRKWFVLESLQDLNRQGTGELVPMGMERVILRLASPQEYRGDMTLTRDVIDHLNGVLKLEGLEVTLGSSIHPRLRAVQAGPPPAKPKGRAHERPPDFLRVGVEPKLAEILQSRWNEAQKCIEAGAHLGAVVMMGSVLEGVLLAKIEVKPADANRAVASPKDKTGKPRPFHEWSLSNLIDVAHELGWLQGDVKRFSHSLRESRNMVHPYHHRALREDPDADTCSICWQVVRAAVADAFGVDEPPKSKGTNP